MPPDLALLSTLISSNYPCLELIFMVPKVFEPLKFNCIWLSSELALSVAWLFTVKLMVFVLSGMSVLLFDTQGPLGIAMRCFFRVLIFDSL